MERPYIEGDAARDNVAKQRSSGTHDRDDVSVLAMSSHGFVAAVL